MIKPLNNIPVRFFIYDEDIINEYDDTTGNIRECEEIEFNEIKGIISYERHTVFENGVSQICLTKMPITLHIA